MVPRTGRPPSDDPRVHVIPSRYTKAEYAAIRAAAEKAGIPAAQFIREHALAATAHPAGLSVKVRRQQKK